MAPRKNPGTCWEGLLSMFLWADRRNVGIAGESAHREDSDPDHRSWGLAGALGQQMVSIVRVARVLMT